ncbi:Surfactin synthase thioesterase subunit [Pseudomonas delhiensis]|uniref:Surfactin synthase thioesterase subunit n=1 Tax=Pseudomonas delhiensis TaxID=366289 RepID=A0A239I9T5_9PSED|nr:alpha/beta fold hydrolase [Pseudomonas delhiensis]SDK16596.1 Surfactin synthase thioesterase subunit [Pseudomonas delhiensis]SNS90088.1 Surfactin synthase thioesterase subunit [Pseudomonas delhiensis]
MLNEIRQLQQYQQRWFRRFTERPRARLRLFCLAHAGGGARFFANWAQLLPESIELVAIQLPGREERIDEPPIEHMTPLVSAISNVLQPWLDRPYAMFGHSMGAAVAHELCLSIQRQGLPLPLRLLVSGREGPSRNHSSKLHKASDEDFLAAIMALGGTSPALRESPELFTLALPVLRNDYRLIETYHPNPRRPPLSLPIEVLFGQDDPELHPGDAQAWTLESSQGVRLHGFHGGHFYLTPQRQAVTQCISRCLGEYSPESLEMP